jgi:hypothetical protein
MTENNNTQLTETDILRWLRDRAAETELDGLAVNASSDNLKPFRVHYKCQCGTGDTVDAAINDTLAKVRTPQQVVADLEEQLAAARRELKLAAARQELIRPDSVKKGVAA